MEKHFLHKCIYCIYIFFKKSTRVCVLLTSMQRSYQACLLFHSILNQGNTLLNSVIPPYSASKSHVLCCRPCCSMCLLSGGWCFNILVLNRRRRRRKKKGGQHKSSVIHKPESALSEHQSLLPLLHRRLMPQ